MEQVLRLTDERNAYFWATQSGAELDLFLMHDGHRIGVEFKFSETPGTTRAMWSAMDALKLERLFVVHPGADSYPLDNRIMALSIRHVERVVEKQAALCRSQ